LSRNKILGGKMLKKMVVMLLCSFSAALFAQDATAEMEKKAMKVFAADMPAASVSTVKIKKRVGKIYEAFVECNEKFTATELDKARGFGIFRYSNTREIYPNTVPEKNLFRATLDCTSSPGEKNIAVLGIYPLEDIKSIKVTAGDLTGPSGKSIPAGNIEINAVAYDYEPVGVSWYCRGKFAMPTNEIICLKETPRLFYILVDVPKDAEPGKYTCKLSITGGKLDSVAELTVQVRNFRLESFSDEYFFGCFNYIDFSGMEPNGKNLEKKIQEIKKYGMNVLHGKLQSAIVINGSGAEIDFSKIEKNMNLMKKYGFRKCVIEMTGLPNEFVDKMGCKYYDETFNKAYKSMLKSLKDTGEKNGWPDFMVMYDEPREIDTENSRPLARTFWDIENLLKLHNEAGLYAIPTYMGDEGGPRFEDKRKSSTYWEQGSKNKFIMTHAYEYSDKLMRETVKNGNTLYIYNSKYGRYAYGLLTHQVGAKGRLQFWYENGERSFNSCTEFPNSYAVQILADGTYVSTLQWLRSMEGVNDFRYIYTLKKLIERAKDKQSPDVLAAQRYLEDIGKINFKSKTKVDGRMDDTLASEIVKKYTGEKLDEMREKLAGYIMKLN